MLELCGFAGSNYHNKVKLALIEKNIPFKESLTWVGETDPGSSPLGKVPYLITEQGALSESTIILEYLEQRVPEPRLLPADPFAAAKVRELVQYLDLHLELVARNLYTEAFFGGTVSDSAKAKVGKQLKKNIAAFAQLAKFSPYIAGEEFTIADCAAVTHFPLISSATKKIYGEDYLTDLPIKAYMTKLAERESVQRVNEERKANAPLFAQYLESKRKP